MNMKKTLILLYLITCYMQLYSQYDKELHTDSIFIIADDDFSNVESFTKLIFNLLDSTYNKYKDSLCCGRMILFIRTNEFGRIDSCSVIESFRPDIDSLTINTIKKIDFGNAVAYSASRVPMSMSFTLPIVFKQPIENFMLEDEYSQQIFCSDNDQADLSLIQVVLSDYIKNEKPDEGIIILIEYLLKDDSNAILTVLESINHYELFYRKPQCYFIESGRIIYLITEREENKLDSAFYDNLFFDTLKILYYSNKSTNKNYFNNNSKENILTRDSYRICWNNDSIISMKDVKINMKHMSLNPIPIQYTLEKGRIVSKNYINKVLFPDTSTPKGASDYYFRKPPYWNKTTDYYFRTSPFWSKTID